MNAWFWRFVVVGNLSIAVAWVAYWWPDSPWLAVAGVGILLCGAGLQLGMQMLLMRGVSKRRGLPVPTWPVTIKAWWAEWRLSLQVFGWRLPFRVQAQADGMSAEALGQPVQGQVGMVLVHGYFCNRAVWSPWLQRLKQQGIACAAMTLEPSHGATMDAMVADLDACIQTMRKATGRAPLVVAHSMGGLVVRAWLKTLSAEDRAQQVAHVVTVATPHQGTWLARFAQRLPAVDMRESSQWLADLGQPPADVGMTCWCSRCDNIVFPSTLAVLPGCEVHEVGDAAHMQLLFDERVWAYCLAKRAQLQARADSELQ